MCAVALRPSTMDPEAPGSAVLQPTNDEPKALFLPGVRSAFTFFYSSNSPGCTTVDPSYTLCGMAVTGLHDFSPLFSSLLFRNKN